MVSSDKRPLTQFFPLALREREKPSSCELYTYPLFQAPSEGKFLFRVGNSRQYFPMISNECPCVQEKEMTCELPLDGLWEMRRDPACEGESRGWFAEVFSGDVAVLPGTVETNPREPEAREGSLNGFMARYPFTGMVWYQREIEVPGTWLGKVIVLELERCQWETQVWVDGQFIGTRNSLVAPHIYTLPDVLTAGRHLLTIAVDNSNLWRGMQIASEDPTAHVDLTTEVQEGKKLNCGGHHLASHNWNGIIGGMTLRAMDPVHIAALQLFPRLGDQSVGVAFTIRYSRGMIGSVEVRAKCAQQNLEATAGEAHWTLLLDGSSEQVFEQRLNLIEPALPWDEFTPQLYRLSLKLCFQGNADTRSIIFGMREIGREGAHLTLNSRRVFLRGTLEDFIFPITGHPPMDVAAWRKIIAVAKFYGLNHFRFHTCCPPSAAFVAADELGFYFQVEVPGTSCPQCDEGPEVDTFLTEELTRILDHYGNHPSLLLISMGNEQLIADAPDFVARHQEVLARRVRFAQAKDPRHFYTSTTQPFTPGRPDDFFVSAWPVASEDRINALRKSHQEGHSIDEPSLCGCQWSGFRVIDTCRFNTRAPETTSDYSACLEGLERPLLSHEVGSWAVYPDLREISRYHGAQRAANFEIIRERLRERGLLEWAADFTRASGMLVLALYKEEIESALRTQDLSGFQLLDLHDYPGQGTSTVGILNALWESKGLVTPGAFRAFCAPVVPLARLQHRILKNNFTAGVDIANYGPTLIHGRNVSWQLQGTDGRIVAQGTCAAPIIPEGGVTHIGTAGADLTSLTVAEKLTFRVELAGVNVNSWSVWVFPAVDIPDVPAGVTVATQWDENARQTLREGGCLLLLPGPEELQEIIPGTFTTAFWNVQMKHAQPAKTMGLLIDHAHPCLDGFPTDYHSDWQWWDLVMRSSALRLDGLPQALRPAVTVIDSFTENRRLAMVVEAKVGKGRLLICSTDLITSLETRPAAMQLKRSLLAYMAGPLFLPDVPVTESQLETLFLRR